MTAVDRYTKQAIEGKGWIPGSTLENRFLFHLNRIGARPSDLVQQHTVGRFRIDFADPDVLIGIEADGFYHRMPGAAERDKARDSWLLQHGWFLFRISDDCAEQDLQERLASALILLREERIYQGLPWKRQPGMRRSTRPSRLARIAGYVSPEGVGTVDTPGGPQVRVTAKGLAELQKRITGEQTALEAT
jgi:very-short-patch-repair endonuclease